MEVIKMSHKNYSKHFKNNNDKHVVSPELEESVVAAGGEVMRVEQPEVNDEVVENPEVLTQEEVDELKEEDVATVNDDGDLTGVVTGCNLLYVREKASKESNHLCIIKKDDEVVIDMNESTTEDFYKVCTATGVEGYCMKKFISIK